MGAPLRIGEPARHRLPERRQARQSLGRVPALRAGGTLPPPGQAQPPHRGGGQPLARQDASHWRARLVELGRHPSRGLHQAARQCGHLGAAHPSGDRRRPRHGGGGDPAARHDRSPAERQLGMHARRRERGGALRRGGRTRASGHDVRDQAPAPLVAGPAHAVSAGLPRARGGSGAEQLQPAHRAPHDRAAQGQASPQRPAAAPARGEHPRGSPRTRGRARPTRARARPAPREGAEREHDPSPVPAAPGDGGGSRPRRPARLGRGAGLHAELPAARPAGNRPAGAATAAGPHPARPGPPVCAALVAGQRARAAPEAGPAPRELCAPRVRAREAARPEPSARARRGGSERWRRPTRPPTSCPRCSG